MKRLLIFLICSVLALSSFSAAAGAAQTELAEEAAEITAAEEAADISDKEPAAVGATADEAAPTGYKLLSESEFQNKLSSLRSKYPNGSIWEGVYYEDGYAKAWTCWAYSCQMMYEIFGVKFYADGMLSNKYYDTSGICAGDWVRIDWDSHSIFITKVTSSGVYYTDGNGTGVYNQVRWDGYYSWSEINNRFSYRIHIPGNSLTGNVEEIKHTIAYNANGGKGSMSSHTAASGATFTLKANEFSRSDHSFSGYIVRRSYDNTYYTTDAGWKTQSEIINNSYHYKVYPQGKTYPLSSAWIGGVSGATTFTFYAQWLPDYSTVEFAANYSGYNYILGSDLGKGYSDYIFSRDSSTYSVEVDKTARLNNADSLKITGKTAGSSGHDLAVITSTNKGYSDGYSQTGQAGDDKDLTLHFYAKANTDGATMYLRWGYSSNFATVSLTKEWQAYTVKMPKNRFYGTAIHPYFDQKGTYYLNSLALGDRVYTTNVTPETGTWAAASRTVRRGAEIGDLPEPERAGYIFLGWYTAAEGGNSVTSGSIINDSTLRLYAHWQKEVSYTPVKTVEYNGHYYDLYNNSLGWEDASAFCSSVGGHLVTIGSAVENAIVYHMIDDLQGYCWIGLHYLKNAEKWEWVDSTSLSAYSKWYDSSYGKKDTGEYYGLLYPMDYGSTPYAGTWDKCVGSKYYSSYYGFYNSFFICEYDDPKYCGDTDGSGEVDIVDATLIQRSEAGLKTDAADKTMLCGDVDGSGKADVIDATLIRRYLAKQEVPYDIGGLLRKII